MDLKRDESVLTEVALKEARGIMQGTISAKIYTSARELFTELDAEMDSEERSERSV